jgi:uncharacterized protein YggE
MKTEKLFATVTIIALAITGVVLVATVLYPQGIIGTNQINYIMISASGFASSRPSQAIVSLNINGSGATTAMATANISVTLNVLNSSLEKYINGNTTLIKTLSYSLYKVYNESVYTAVESLQVKIPNIQNVSPLLGDISSVPNVYVSDVSAVLSDSQATALRSQALQNALANATAQAQALAGNKILTLHNITVNSYYIYPYSLGASAALRSDVTPAFFGGENKVVESITTSFSYT